MADQASRQNTDDELWRIVDERTQRPISSSIDNIQNNEIVIRQRSRSRSRPPRRQSRRESPQPIRVVEMPRSRSHHRSLSSSTTYDESDKDLDAGDFYDYRYPIILPREERPEIDTAFELHSDKVDLQWEAEVQQKFRDTGLSRAVYQKLVGLHQLKEREKRTIRKLGNVQAWMDRRWDPTLRIGTPVRMFSDDQKPDRLEREVVNIGNTRSGGPGYVDVVEIPSQNVSSQPPARTNLASESRADAERKPDQPAVPDNDDDKRGEQKAKTGTRFVIKEDFEHSDGLDDVKIVDDAQLEAISITGSQAPVKTVRKLRYRKDHRHRHRKTDRRYNTTPSAFFLPEDPVTKERRILIIDQRSLTTAVGISRISEKGSPRNAKFLDVPGANRNDESFRILIPPRIGGRGQPRVIPLSRGVVLDADPESSGYGSYYSYYTDNSTSSSDEVVTKKQKSERRKAKEKKKRKKNSKSRPRRRSRYSYASSDDFDQSSDEEDESDGRDKRAGKSKRSKNKKKQSRNRKSRYDEESSSSSSDSDDSSSSSEDESDQRNSKRSKAKRSKNKKKQSRSHKPRYRDKASSSSSENIDSSSSSGDDSDKRDRKPHKSKRNKTKKKHSRTSRPRYRDESSTTSSTSVNSSSPSTAIMPKPVIVERRPTHRRSSDSGVSTTSDTSDLSKLIAREREIRRRRNDKGKDEARKTDSSKRRTRRNVSSSDSDAEDRGRRARRLSRREEREVVEIAARKDDIDKAKKATKRVK